jgi:hypothetical protein
LKKKERRKEVSEKERKKERKKEKKEREIVPFVPESKQLCCDSV